MRFLLLGFSLSFVIACVTSSGGGGTNPAPRPRPAPVDHTGHTGHTGGDHTPTPKRDPKPAGAQCQASAECESGVCEGEGCGDTPGTCAPAQRACTRDLRQYCGCDGKTFQASGSCPGQRFSAKAACGAP